MEIGLLPQPVSPLRIALGEQQRADQRRGGEGLIDLDEVDIGNASAIAVEQAGDGKPRRVGASRRPVGDLYVVPHACERFRVQGLRRLAARQQQEGCAVVQARCVARRDRRTAVHGLELRQPLDARIASGIFVGGERWLIVRTGTPRKTLEL